eukprot:m.255001 g.255001  ORF g.255001 m.255001 type:complete len:83 (-) comp11009_c1_seq20:1006-1254(-)
MHPAAAVPSAAVRCSLLEGLRCCTAELLFVPPNPPPAPLLQHLLPSATPLPSRIHACLLAERQAKSATPAALFKATPDFCVF